MSTFTLIAPISNIHCSSHIINLGDNTEIRQFPNKLSPLIQRAQEEGYIRHPADYTHCLVIRHAKVLRDDRVDVRERLEEAVLRLRLYRAGDIGFNFAFVDKDGWEDKLDSDDAQVSTIGIISVFHYVVWAHRGMPPFYELESNDIPLLQSLFSLAVGKKLMDRPAFRFFFRAYHEPYPADRFLRNAIGLENLLVNDTNEQSNVSYKFVDRGVFLLSQAKAHSDGAEGYVSSLKDIYNKRSKLVHSNKSPNSGWSGKDAALLQSSEEYLRTLLNYILHNPCMGLSGEVDKAKRKRYGLKLHDDSDLQTCDL